MTVAKTYVLDANVFIEAARRYYAFDLAPAFWRALLDHAESGRVRSIDRVEHELLRGNYDLKDWVQGEFGNWFASTDEAEVIDVYRRIMTWAHGQGQFTDAAKSAFASGADGWLVAYASVHGSTVVTHEQFHPEARGRIFIPNVCRAFGVLTIDTFAMLRALGVTLG